jgi:hypothetical protein
VSFIDDFSKFTWIYLLRHKSEVFQKFHDFQSMVERQFDKKILAIQTDWGGEYQKLNSFFQRIGISHHVSCPHAHQQNGSAERKHRHIVEVGLSLLAHASMPLKFWDEAFITATYLINRLPSKVIHGETPLERLFHHKPDYLTILVNSNLGPNNVPFLVIVIFTKASSVLTSPRVVSTSLVMSFLMRRCSPLLRSTQTQELALDPRSYFFPRIF